MSGDDDFRALITMRFDIIEAKVDETLAQAKATNGRVTTLEKWRERTEGARDALGMPRAIVVIVASGLTVAGVGEFVRYLATH